MLPKWLAHLQANSVRDHASLAGVDPADFVVPEMRDCQRMDNPDFDYLTMNENGVIVAGTFEAGVTYTASF